MFQVNRQSLKTSKAFSENRAGLLWGVTLLVMKPPGLQEALVLLRQPPFSLTLGRKDRLQDSGVVPGL